MTNKRGYMVGWISLEDRWYGVSHYRANGPLEVVERLAEDYFEQHPTADPNSLTVLFVAETNATTSRQAFIEFLSKTPMYPFLGTDVYPKPSA